MEFRQLESFLTLCEELHFTRAAERLGITQPTLSYQMKSLEDEFGIYLFDRIGKKIALTEAGHILKERALNIMNHVHGAREEIQQLKNVKRGKLTVGTLPGELSHFVSKILFDFHRKFADVRVQILESDDVVERVLKNEIDFALTILPAEDERLARRSMYEEEFLVAVAERHPLAGREIVSLEDILKEPLVLFPASHKCRQLLDATCKSGGSKLQPNIETSSIETIMSLVEQGIGISILSETLLKREQRSGIQAIRLDRPIRRQVGIVHLKDKYIGPAVQTYMDLLIAFLTDEDAVNESAIHSFCR